MNRTVKQIKEYGDYQTPAVFAEQVCQLLQRRLTPDVILEPTFGVGNFLLSGLRLFPGIQKIFGIEINANYFAMATQYLKDKVATSVKVHLYNADIFTFDFTQIKAKLNPAESILIIGNPPWVTSAELTSINSSNLPHKVNFKGLNGLDAITGKGNFDITESIILQMLKEFRDYNCHIAMLCKNVVAKNIVHDLPGYDFSLAEIAMYEFNARSVFQVNCQASLLLLKPGQCKTFTCDVYDFADPDRKKRTFGWTEEGHFIADLAEYALGREIDGVCPWEWRQGIKHDCSKVMELSYGGAKGSYRNGFQEDCTLEEDYLFPLLKSSDLKGGIITQSRKWLIVTQKKINSETDSLRWRAPQLWKYLEDHADILDQRKSSIYKNSPRFAIFGVGEYSFKPYKIAISGFYKDPSFSLVFSDSGQVMLLDDTCYFIGFDDYNQALITLLLLNSNLVKKLIRSIAFRDSKRPYTKEILMRIDLEKTAQRIDYEELLAIAKECNEPVQVTKQDYEHYKQTLKKSTVK